ncbi:MAG: Asp-tRNA(Asn)/Glu-tRNA(Gln) amidotransferase subunit GatC [bacterium]|nr:Asp-tRNA(Asn)/Glu-tRNA(Gln) amidotransferase subunit GatC [bacterium]
MSHSTISRKTVHHIAELANLPIDDATEERLVAAFEETLAVIDTLQTLDVSAVVPTSQVTGLENILREDKVETERMFTQAQALANASHQHQGYFMVPQVIAQSD